jgi:hypothetical protein
MYKFYFVAWIHADKRSTELLYIRDKPMPSDLNRLIVSLDRSDGSDLVPVKSTHGARQPTENAFRFVPLRWIQGLFEALQQAIIAGIL